MFLLLFIATGVEAKSSAGYVGGIVMESQSSQGGRNHCGENACPDDIPGFADEANHSRANRRKIRYKQQIGRYIAFCIRMSIDHFFPDLYQYRSAYFLLNTRGASCWDLVLQIGGF
jgi:hypothetical protein